MCTQFHPLVRMKVRNFNSFINAVIFTKLSLRMLEPVRFYSAVHMNMIEIATLYISVLYLVVFKKYYYCLP